ncbi:unnamed protein product, partial [marine sediment metagenome]
GGIFDSGTSTITFTAVNNTARTIKTMPSSWFYGFEIDASTSIIALSPLDINNVTITSGTFEMGPFMHNVSGDWTQLSDGYISVVPSSMCVVRLEGDSDSSVYTTGNSSFNVLVVDKTSGSVVSLTGSNISTYFLNISSGTLDIGSCDVNLGTTTFISAGKLKILDGSINFPNGEGEDCLIINGGTLEVLNNAATILGYSKAGGGQSRLIIASGTIDISGLTLDEFTLHLGVSTNTFIPSGLNIVKLENLRFNPMSSDDRRGVVLNTTGTYTFNGFEFIASTVNVDATIVPSSSVFMFTGASGAYTGPDYEIDPKNVVFWSTPTAPASISGLAVSTNSINWSWTDSSKDEQGYDVMNDTGDIVYSLPYNTTYWIEKYLATNTTYQRCIGVYN